MVAEHGRAVLLHRGGFQSIRELVAEEEVVAQHEDARRAVEEVLGDDQGLGEPVGAGLHGVLDVEAPALPVAQQVLERRLVLRRGDDQDLAHVRLEQRRERVVDHRLVEDRHELLAHADRGGVQARAGSTREDDALAIHVGPLSSNAARSPSRQWGSV